MKGKLKRGMHCILSMVLVAATVFGMMAVPAQAVTTSTAARIYDDLTTSPAYKNYSEFAKLYVPGYSAPIPGLEHTDVNGKDCTTMVPQGLCIAKDYMIISAYDSNGSCKSVLYIMSNDTPSNRKYLMTLVLPISTHVGGVAYDGTYVWVSNGKNASSIKYSTLASTVKSAVSNSKKSVSISFHSTCATATQASFMTYNDGMLWVGEFKDKGDSSGRMYSYKVASDGKSLTKKYYITLPDRTQGACFRDGYLFLSRSYTRSTSSSSHISQLRVYKPSAVSSSGNIAKNDAIKVVDLPPMVEGIAAGSTYFYSIYESSATLYYKGSDGNGKCKYPVDRIVAFKLSDLTGTSSSSDSSSSSGTTSGAYFPACSSSYESLVSALNSIGVDSSFTYRTTIAEANGISNYSGTADQNDNLLSLLKAGKLINPDGSSDSGSGSGSGSSGTTTQTKYFPACSSSYESIVAALDSIGVDSSKAYRTTIAEANGISGYTGTAAQNEAMLDLLKAGKLINPDYSGSGTTPIAYYPACASSYDTIVKGLNSIGVDSSKEYRTKIAIANGISNYTGTVEQNETLLALLKAGKLIKPEGDTTGSGSESTGCSHNYTTTVVAPTCSSKGYTTHRCSLCGDSYTDTETAALGHNYTSATCTAPKTCTRCGNTTGTALGHSWTAATCTDPATCLRCGDTSGKALGHNWIAAQCTDPMTCATCGTKSGTSLGHSWSEATCTTPATCVVCGETTGAALGHNYVNDSCERCGAQSPYITVYFENNWKWSDVCVYYWGSSSVADIAWRGISMTYVETDGMGYDIYSARVPADAEGIIFNGYMDDGSFTLDQSPNITEFSDQVCYYMVWDNGNAIGTFSYPVTRSISQKGRNLSYEDMIYVIDIFELIGVDGVDLSVDAGLLIWSVDEFNALSEIAFDATHANVGLAPYKNTSYYCGTSDGIFTRDLHEEAYYVGYVKLPNGSYIYSEPKLYSPAIYAYTMLGKDTTSAETKELCVALLNYISAAQVYFHGTAAADQVNAKLTDAQKALSWNNVPMNLAPAVPSNKQVAKNEDVFTGTGKNLLFEEMISMTAIFKISDSIIDDARSCGTIFWTAEQFAELQGTPSISNYGNGTKTSLAQYRNTPGQWYSLAPEVAAKEMADTQYYYMAYVVHSDGSISYSGVSSYTIETYINNKADTTISMGRFAIALYHYERAAKAALGG